MLKRGYSFLSDKRMPHLMLTTLINSWKNREAGKSVKAVDKLFVAITFDVEKDPLKRGTSGLDKFLSIKRKKATFFVEGGLVEEFKHKIKKLQTKNEVGLHGFDHEIWGDEKWWATGEVLNREEKKDVLEKSLKIFSDSKLKRPKSFRAPFMISNDETIKILKSFGFNLDSSPESYMGINPVPKNIFGVTCIPVSVNPVAKVSMKNFIPYVYYDMFTIKRALTFDDSRLIEFVKSVSSVQQLHSCPPHLVFLAHPWEFMRIKDKRFNYCSEKNFEVIKNIAKVLEDNYKVKYVTMQELRKRLV